MPTTQGYWTEGNIVNGTNVGGGVWVPGVAPAPAPAPAPVPTPTPTSTAVSVAVPTRTPSRYEQSLDNQTATVNSYQDLLDKNRAYQAQQRQLRIDAINTTFAPRIAREKEEGDNRLSRVAALNAKSGVIGSGVDATRLEGQKGLNKQALQDIEDSKAMAIQAAFDKADELALKESEMEYNAAVKGAEANVMSQKAKLDAAKETLALFGNGGTGLEALKISDPNTYNNIKNLSGMSDFEMDNYLTANNPEAKVLKTEIVGNKVVTVTQVGNKTEVKTYETDIQPQEEFETVNGVGYGVTRDADGKLIMRPLTSKDDGSAGSTLGVSGFSDSDVEADARAEAVDLLDSVDAGDLTLEKAYSRMRTLYSPREVTDEALKGLLGITAPVQTNQPESDQAPGGINTVIENIMSDLLAKKGSVSRADIVLELGKKGYKKVEPYFPYIDRMIKSIQNPLSTLQSFLFAPLK